MLIVHLAKNHPLPDGNKRAAWVAMRLFIEINGWIWRTAPDIDDAERAVLAVAAGEWDTSRWASGCAIASSNHASTEFNQAGHDPKSCGLRLYNRTGSGSRDLP